MYITVMENAQITKHAQKCQSPSVEVKHCTEEEDEKNIRREPVRGDDKTLPTDNKATSWPAFCVYSANTLARSSFCWILFKQIRHRSLCDASNYLLVAGVRYGVI